MDLAFSLDFDRAGRRRDARMAIMAMTTSNSIRVKPRDVFMGSAPDNAPGRRRLQRSFFAGQKEGRVHDRILWNFLRPPDFSDRNFQRPTLNLQLPMSKRRPFLVGVSSVQC